MIRRNVKELLSEEEEKESKDKLRVNAAFFLNNFVRASWIPRDVLTDLRNWHSPMIREWTYRGHTRVGRTVGLSECLPKRYNFVDVSRSSKSAASLPPSFHKMPDMSPQHNQSHINKELRELVQYAHKNLPKDHKASTATHQQDMESLSLLMRMRSFGRKRKQRL